MAVAPAIARADRVTDAADADATTEQLFEQFYERVYRYCLYHLGSPDDAEDAAQLTFVHALGGLRRGAVPRFAPGWLFAIAKNVCLDRRQARARRRGREVLQDPATLEYVAGTAEADGDDVVGLRQALDHISEHQREAVLLREWRGLSYREIAAQMNLSVGAVETLIFRARRSLAAQLAGQAETKRERAVRGFALAPVAAALKSMFATASAKLGVAVVLAAAAAVSAGGLIGMNDVPDRPERPGDAPFADVSAEAPTYLRPASVPHVEPRTPQDNREPQEGRHADKGRGAPVSPAEEPTTPATDDVLEGATPVLEAADDLVGQASAALEPVLEPVEPMLAPVHSTVESVLPELDDASLSGLESTADLP